MGKNTKTKIGVDALKIVSTLCFLIALALIVFPASQPISEVAAPAEIPHEALMQLPEEIALPHSKKLIPLGSTTGIKMFSEGTMVVGFAKLESCGDSPAQRAGLQLGDIITAVNGTAVTSNESLVSALKNAGDENIALSAKRDDKTLSINVCAVHDDENSTYKIGAWVRDSIAGIGTITFVDPENGAFGALGHGISDADTGKLMIFSNGSVMGSSVVDVKKGQSGTPGELVGKFDLSENQGLLYSNTTRGIFGRLTNTSMFSGQKALELASKDDIQIGHATIICNIEGSERTEYDIEILRVYSENDGSSRDMMIKVTDPELIAKTGGIVQGMSGSPIVQNGKLIGAVTHVLINDPQRGYAISIQNMLAGAFA